MRGKTEREISLAKEKLEAAGYLFKGGFYRDAVSRAYYSMYHSARALLGIKEIHPRTHSGVVKEWSQVCKRGRY